VKTFNIGDAPWRWRTLVPKNKSGNSADEESAILVRVRQRIRIEEDTNHNGANNTNEERSVIWHC
jgi:hypothetical protein